MQPVSHEKDDPLAVRKHAAVFQGRERLQSELERRHVNCTLLILDLDEFKPVNDTLGHLAEAIKILGVASATAGVPSKTD